MIEKKEADQEVEMIGTINSSNPRLQEIQEILRDLGYNPGNIDGRMGQDTRNALKKFQETMRLKITGRIDSPTVTELLRAKAKLHRLKTNKPRESKKDQTFSKSQIEMQDEILSYRFKSRERIKKIQTALKNAEFYDGIVDGKMGPQTKAAIIAFQKSKNLNADGIVGTRTWQELKQYSDSERR